MQALTFEFHSEVIYALAGCRVIYYGVFAINPKYQNAFELVLDH